MTQVTGYQLREAIRRLELRRDALQAVFQDSLQAFPGESKPAPQATGSELMEIEEAISNMQTAQAAYNLQVKLPNGMLLCTAIKLIGAAGRNEKRWREVASPKKKDSYYDRDTVRREGETRASSTVDPATAAGLAQSAAKIASDIRSGIAMANATTVDLSFSFLEKWI